MKAQELRIGNLVKQGFIFDIGHIEGKFGVRIIENWFDSFSKPYIISDIEPILLTEEWLLKLGFEWDIYYQGYTDGNWVINPNDEKGYRLSYGKRRYDTIVWNIETVHQLQNLYFALTGEEITI